MSCFCDFNALLRGRDHGHVPIPGGARDAHAREGALRLLCSGVLVLTPARSALNSSS